MPGIVDCHAHDIVKAIYPRELFVGRFTLPRFLVNGLCDAIEDGLEMCLPLRLAWKLLPGKLQRYERLIRLYLGSLEDQARALTVDALASGVSQVWVLGLDIPSVGEYGPVRESRPLQLQLSALEALPGISNGLLLPFYPFDPRREGAAVSAIATLAGGRFGGVKMYPALGYNVEAVGDPKMAWHRNLCDAFEAFEAQGLGVVVHCSGGGVRGPEVREGDMKWLSSPERWRPVLKRFPKLKVSFAHATGEAGFLTLPNPKPGTWAWHLRDLMLSYSGVYADISFHSGLVESPKRYRAGFEKILITPLRRKVLFGSDAPLHFGQYSYKQLIQAARESVPGVDTLLASNAREFLAFDGRLEIR